jgi:hypothetical protein
MDQRVATRASAAHNSLRSVLHYANAELVESACIDISVTTAMIDEDGLVGDPAVRDALGRLVSNLDNRR